MIYFCLGQSKCIKKFFPHHYIQSWRKFKTFSRTCTEIKGLFKEKWNSRTFEGLPLKFKDFSRLSEPWSWCLISPPPPFKKEEGWDGLRKVQSILLITKKTTVIMQCHHWFPHKMMSKKKMQKLHTNDASLATQSWVVLLIGCATREIASANEKYYPALGNDTSSGSNFCAHFLKWRGNQWWHHKMSAVFSS